MNLYNIITHICTQSNPLSVHAAYILSTHLQQPEPVPLHVCSHRVGLPEGSRAQLLYLSF